MYPQLVQVSSTMGTCGGLSVSPVRARTGGATISPVTQPVFPQAAQVVSMSFSSIHD